MTITKESAKYHVNLQRSASLPLLIAAYVEPTTAIAPQMRASTIVATISLCLAMKATMNPINRNVMRCSMSRPVDAKNKYGLR
jgi:hypothetical protein